MKKSELPIDGVVINTIRKTRKKSKGKECRDTKGITMVILNCANCHNDFEIPKTQYLSLKRTRGLTRKCCSYECFCKYRSSQVRKDIVVSEVIKRYMEDKLSTAEIAKDYNVSPALICQILKEEGIILRKKRIKCPEKGEMVGDSIFLGETDIRTVSCKPKTIWRMKCICGNEYEAKKEYILSGQNKNCGCKYQDFPDRCLGEACRNELFGTYKTNAKRKGILFSLTKEKFLQLTSQNCFYCNIEPSSLVRDKREHRKGFYVYNGVDRVDSLKGYTELNCVPCCKNCNLAKNNMSIERFLDMIKRIYIFKQLDKNKE